MFHSSLSKANTLNATSGSCVSVFSCYTISILDDMSVGGFLYLAFGRMNCFGPRIELKGGSLVPNEVGFPSYLQGVS